VLFVVALLAGALAPAGFVSVPLSLPFVIVMMLLARRIWDTAPERQPRPAWAAAVMRR